MKLVFLGTGGSYPSRERNLSSVALKMNGEVILFDCAEGTQRQMMFTSVSFMKISCILLSHFHGDHFLGLPGLVQTMYLNEREEPLDIYGPPKTVKRITALLGLGHFHPSFEIRVHDVGDGQVIDKGAYTITSCWAKHGVPNMAFAIEEKDRPGRFDKPTALALGIPEGPLFGKLQRGETVEHNGKTFTPEMVLGPSRPGRKIVYSGDTAPCDAVVELSKGADVLIHDSTGASELKEKMDEYGHSTPAGAAEIAKKAGVKHLFLTHISPRYRNDDLPMLEAEAREVFENSHVAKDFLEFDVPLSE